MYHRVTEDIEKQVRANGKVIFDTCIKLSDLTEALSGIHHEAKYAPASGLRETVAKFMLTTTDNHNYIIYDLELVETCKDPGQKIFVYIMILEAALREANTALMRKVIVESRDRLIVEAFLQKKFCIRKTKFDIDKDIYIYSGTK